MTLTADRDAYELWCPFTPAEMAARYEALGVTPERRYWGAAEATRAAGIGPGLREHAAALEQATRDHDASVQRLAVVAAEAERVARMWGAL